jgi:hypothetical protein
MTDAELRALAAKATPGPWTVGPFWAIDTGIYVAGDYCLATTQTDSEEEGVTSTAERKSRDAAYIAAASPDTILALLDRVEKAEAALTVERIAEAMHDFDRSWVGLGQPWSMCGMGNRKPYLDRAAALRAALLGETKP